MTFDLFYLILIEKLREIVPLILFHWQKQGELYFKHELPYFLY